MRTFEAPAMGACLVMERTDEQIDIFGEEDSTVRYFQDPNELLTVCKELLEDQSARSRLRQEAHQCITQNSHSYKHRLQELLDARIKTGLHDPNLESKNHGTKTIHIR